MNAAADTAVIPRGTYTGAPLCRPRGKQRFFQCLICGSWVDSLDSQQMTEHEGSVTPAVDVSVAKAS